MKKAALIAMLLFATMSWAGASADDYSTTAHVTGSRWVFGPTSSSFALYQRLDATIDGKKYELQAYNFSGNIRVIPILALGDYKAKLIQDVHKNAYEYSQSYEFLFADGKTRKFLVIGQSE